MKRLNPHPPGSRRHDDLKKFHQKSGVYLLLINRTLYVGSSKNLRNRLRRWSVIYPGARYSVSLCANHREAEQKVITALRARARPLANAVNAIKPIRVLKPPRVRKTKPPGPGRIPARLITVGGVTRTLREWCRLAAIPTGLFYARVQIGWTEQAAIQPRTLAPYTKPTKIKKST